MNNQDWHLPTEHCELPVGTIVRWNTTDGENSGSTFDRELLDACLFGCYYAESKMGHVNRKDGKKIRYLERKVGYDGECVCNSFGLSVHSIRLPQVGMSGAVGVQCASCRNETNAGFVCECRPTEREAQTTVRDVYREHRENERFNIDTKLTVDQIQANAAAYERNLRALAREKTQQRAIPHPGEGKSCRVYKQNRRP